MMKGDRVTSSSHLLAVICILLLYSHPSLSSDSRECYNCRDKECRGDDEGRSEKCVGRANTCAMWIWRKAKPEENIKVGDVYKKECAQLLVANEGCKEMGLYIRCVCKGHLCNVNSLVEIKDAKSATTTQKPATTTSEVAVTTDEVQMTEIPTTTTTSEVSDMMTSEVPDDLSSSSTKKPKKKVKTKVIYVIVPANSTGTIQVGKLKSTKETNVQAQSYNYSDKAYDYDKYSGKGGNLTESERIREKNIQSSSYNYRSKEEKEGRFVQFDTRVKGDQENATGQDNLKAATELPSTTTTTTELPVPREPGNAGKRKGKKRKKNNKTKKKRTKKKKEGEENNGENEHGEEGNGEEDEHDKDNEGENDTEEDNEEDGESLQSHFLTISDANESLGDTLKPRNVELEISG